MRVIRKGVPWLVALQTPNDMGRVLTCVHILFLAPLESTVDGC